MPITISSDFDAGNIEVLNIDGAKAELNIRKDNQSDFYQWFYFRVDGAANLALELSITNAGGSAYPGGWPGYRACVSDDNATWVRTDTGYDNGTLTIRHTPSGDTVWFAYFAPYSEQRHQTLIADYSALPGVSHTVLGLTLDGRPMDLLTLGEGPLQVWLYARQHPGETMAEWWMEGALDVLTGNDPAIAALRRAATINIVPNMNPDGSARGHLRTNAVGVNLNREWVTPSAERSPEVLCVLDRMAQTGVDFAIDVHGDEAIPHVFLAGFDGIPSWNEGLQALYDQYAQILAGRTPDFQTTAGYPKNAPGTANLTISGNQMAERFGAVSMTLEMPFKDHDDAPDPVAGWSPDRSRALGRQSVLAICDMLDSLSRKYTSAA